MGNRQHNTPTPNPSPEEAALPPSPEAEQGGAPPPESASEAPTPPAEPPNPEAEGKTPTFYKVITKRRPFWGGKPRPEGYVITDPEADPKAIETMLARAWIQKWVCEEK